MKTLMLFCLLVLTVSVRLLTARANHDNMEAGELSVHETGARTGRQENMSEHEALLIIQRTPTKNKTDAAQVRTLSELIFNKNSYKDLVNNLLLWILFILTEYAFQFV